MAYYYDGSGTSADDWASDDGVDEEGHGIYSDLDPTPAAYTGDEDGIDPSLLMQTSPASVYPPIHNYSYNEQNGAASSL